MNLLKYSQLFKLGTFMIEFCLGVIVEKDRIIISYSENDATTRLLVCDKNYINSLIWKNVSSINL